EVQQAQAPFAADGVEYPKGSYVIKMSQPFGSFAKTMLEKQVYPDLREYPGGPPQRPYDVTAHTLPLQMGVNVVTIARPFDASLTLLADIRARAEPVEGARARAYLLEHDRNASMKALTLLLAQKADVYWPTKPLSIRGRSYPPAR